MEYFLKKFIDYLFRKKSLYSCVFLILSFIISQIAVIGQSKEITDYCNRIQNNNPNNIKYDLAQIAKILYTEGSTMALVISSLLLGVFIILILLKERKLKSEIDFVKAYEDVRDGKIEVKMKSFKDLPPLP